jgi:hypothetical protein
MHLLLVQRHIDVAVLGAVVADDSPVGCSSEAVYLENLSVAGGTDDHALAHSL